MVETTGKNLLFKIKLIHYDPVQKIELGSLKPQKTKHN